MDPLSITASIIAILQLTSKVIEYLNDIKDAPKDRARCAIEASNIYNLLTTLRYRLEEGSSNEPWYTAIKALGVQNGPLNQYRHVLEQLLPKITNSSGIKKMGNTLMWKLSKEEVANMLSRMERLNTLVQIALEMDHFKLSQAIKNDTDLVRKSIPALEMGIDAVQQEQNRQQCHNILEWISSTDFPAQQSDFIARRQEGTGLWFLDSPEFAKWIHESKRLCSLQTTTSLLSAILKQLAQARPSVPEPVARLYDCHAKRKTRPSLEEIINALQSVLSNYSSAYVVVDALDECPDKHGTRSQLLAKLRDLQSKTDLRLMVTSRFIPDIENKFKSTPRLEVRASNADVKRFVAGQMYRLPKCVQRDDELQGFVQDRIADAVDGMFLLARLHVDSLLDKRTKTKVQSALVMLGKSSKALDEAYDEAIKRVDGQLPDDSALAKSVLSWITYAQRPLSMGELRHALAVEVGEEELDPDNILDVEDVISVCAGLVIVDEESHIIRLVHYTTQEYFERIREGWNPTAQQEIVSTCLTYLSLDTFRSGSCSSDKGFESRLEQNVLLDYAARYWGRHALTVQEEVCELALSLLQDINLVSCAVQTMTIPEDLANKFLHYPYSRNFPICTTGLHLTARFGLLYLSEKILQGLGGDTMTLVDSKDGYGQTPLFYAAKEGHEAVVELLVERDDVEANSKNRYGDTPLSYAAEEGHEAVVKLLVERDDVKADSKDYFGHTPLFYAEVGGHEAVAKLLKQRIQQTCDRAMAIVGNFSPKLASHETLPKVLQTPKPLFSNLPRQTAIGSGHTGNSMHESPA